MMLRSMLVGAVCFGFGSSSALAVEVAKELAEINAKFSETMRVAENKREAYPIASAERVASLEKLVVAAEAEKSTEHRVLAQVYLSLDKNDDALRQADAALAVDADDFPARAVQISALTKTGKSEQAAESLRTLMASSVDEKNAIPFVGAGSGAVSAAVYQQTAAEKFDAATALVDQWKAKLEGIKSEDAAVKKVLETATRGVAVMNSQIAANKFRVSLIGKPYTPLENPTWLNGEPISQEQLHGKVVLLDFWAVWCGPCIATFPHLIEWHDKYADKGLVIVGVTERHRFGWNAEDKKPQSQPDIEPAKEDEATVEFAKHHGLKHRLAVVTDKAAAKAYGVTGIPEIVVIDQNGIVRMIRVGSGAKTAHDVEAEIRKLLGLGNVAAKD